MYFKEMWSLRKRDYTIHSRWFYNFCDKIFQKKMQAVASWMSHKVDSLVENDIILNLVVIPGKTPSKRAGERIVAPSQRAPSEPSSSARPCTIGSWASGSLPPDHHQLIPPVE